MKLSNSIAALFALSVLISCSKDDKDENGLVRPQLEGQIVYEYTSDVKKIDLSSWNESIFFSYNAYSTIGWDLSRDGKIRLISERESGTIRGTRFKLVNVDDGSIIREFDYFPEEGTNQRYSGKLSYDNTQILLDPDFDNGIVVMDTQGQVKYHLEGINGEAFSIADRAYWLPGNSLLIRFQDRYILRSDPPYSALSLVKEMNYEQWGSLRASRDGKKLSLYIDKHIYLMDIDGSNLTQVTESSGTENLAEFSPDGRHLLVGTDYVHAPTAGRSNWKLRIIPADGKLYNIDSSSEVIPVVPKNTDMIATAGANTHWVP